MKTSYVLRFVDEPAYVTNIRVEDWTFETTDDSALATSFPSMSVAACFALCLMVDARCTIEAADQGELFPDVVSARRGA